MQNPNHPCAHLSRITSRVLRFALRGTGTVLDITGAALACTGFALQVCGQKIKSFAEAHPHDSFVASDPAAAQPA